MFICPSGSGLPTSSVVSTVTTPGAAIAAFVSMRVIRPFATALPTIQP